MTRCAWHSRPDVLAAPQQALALDMPQSSPSEPAPPALHFAEFALRAWRDDPRYVQVIAHATPVGGMRRPVSVKLSRIDRRDFLRVGALGLGGLTLPDVLRLQAQANVGKSPRAVNTVKSPSIPL